MKKEVTAMDFILGMKSVGEFYSAAVEITPSDASFFLTKNRNNRHVSEKVVDQYADMMKKGDWKLNGEAILFDTADRCIQGQHRLKACVKSGVSFETFVICGLPEESFDSLDRGMKRSLAHVLSIRKIKNYTHVASALAIYCQYVKTKGSMGGCNYSPAISEYEMLLDKNQGLLDSVSFVQGGWTVLPVSISAFCHYIFSQKNKPLADKFIRQLLTGIGIAETDPVHKLKLILEEDSKNMKSKLQKREKFALIFKAWNATKQGSIIKNLKWRQGGDIPEKFPEII